MNPSIDDLMKPRSYKKLIADISGLMASGKGMRWRDAKTSQPVINQFDKWDKDNEISVRVLVKIKDYQITFGRYYFKFRRWSGEGIFGFNQDDVLKWSYIPDESQSETPTSDGKGELIAALKYKEAGLRIMKTLYNNHRSVIKTMDVSNEDKRLFLNQLGISSDNYETH